MPPEDPRTPWFLRPVSVFMAVLFLGPLALPMVWISNALTRRQKWLITALLIILTIWLLKASADLYSTILKELESLKDVLK